MDKRHLVIILGAVALFAIAWSVAAASLWAGSAAASQNEIVVNTLEDELNSDHDCSLREAVAAATSNTAVDACPAGSGVITDTITFASEGAILLSEPITITGDAVISFPINPKDRVGKHFYEPVSPSSVGSLMIDGGKTITIQGGDRVRLFTIYYDAHVTLSGLALTNGSAVLGGAVLNSGRLTIKNSVVSDNSAQ